MQGYFSLTSHCIFFFALFIQVTHFQFFHGLIVFSWRLKTFIWGKKRYRSVIIFDLFSQETFQLIGDVSWIYILLSFSSDFNDFCCLVSFFVVFLDQWCVSSHCLFANTVIIMKKYCYSFWSIRSNTNVSEDN